jgi:hypothetical protein
MKLVGWMIAGSAGSSCVAAALLGMETAPAVWLGMLGPLAAAAGAWIAIERAYRRRPEAVTNLMMKAFVAKMVFFAAYMILLIGGDFVRPVPFAVSFTAYFLALQITVAVALRRLTGVTSPVTPLYRERVNAKIKS